MGRRSSQNKSAAWLDDDDTSSVSFGNVMSDAKEVPVHSESLKLDRCLDALYEKRGSVREKALEVIIEAFNNSIQNEVAEKWSTTLSSQCLNSIKKGSAKELALASHAIGLLALTIGPGEKAQMIFKDSVSPILEALRSRHGTSIISPLLECLAVITFVGAKKPKQTENSMQIMLQVAKSKLGHNVVSAWSFLLSAIDERDLNHKSLQEAVSHFSTLLDKDDRSVRIAAAEALASIFEKGAVTSDRIINQIKRGGCVKKDLSNQKSSFGDILDFIENGCVPETSIKIGGESKNISSWSQLMKLNYLRQFLGGGFMKHMSENPYLHDVFDFDPTPLEEDDCFRSKVKRNSKLRNITSRQSPYAAANKSRTLMLKEGRVISHQDRSSWFDD